MKMRKFIAAALAMVLAALPAAGGYSFEAEATSTEVYFSEFDSSVNGGEPIRGIDVSSILSVEESGVDFYNMYGNKQDIFQTLAENGVNYIRVRIWNDPFDSEGNSYGGGNCTLENAAEIGRRAAQYGMKLMVAFHYSDFWADPDNQAAPKAWSSYTLREKQDAVYNFTTQSLQTIVNAGGDVGIVQVGNETDCVFCGETDMYRICELFKSGIAGVREFDSSIMVALHFANPSTGYYDWYAKVLNECNIDYDIFATSYYSYWHGSMENMTKVMRTIADTYDKYVMVAETAYPYTSEDGDGYVNLISEESEDVDLSEYPLTIEGQIKNICDVFQAIADVGSKGIGAVYWEPAWLGSMKVSWEERCTQWETLGCGWSTIHAAEYDDSITETGGSSYDNQGLFDFYGRPLESLSVFNRIYPYSKEFPVPDGADVAEGEYRLKNLNSGLYLTVANGLSEAGANVVQYQADGAAEYNTWNIRSAGDGYYEIYSALGDGNTYLLDLDRGLTDNSTNIGIYTNTNCDAQKFKLIANDDGSYYITTKSTGDKSAIEVAEAASDSGGNIQQYAVNAMDHQKWVLEPVEEYYCTGDLNSDGIINVFDLMLLKKDLINGSGRNAGDINEDGSFSVVDIVSFQKYIHGNNTFTANAHGTPENTIFPTVE